MNKSKNNERVGFDSPKFKNEEDLLNRWNFAQEIYDIVMNTPSDWSVRIGIFAKWGEGKTTVLNFIKKLALEGGQLCVEFNPWEFTNKEELWESFVYETSMGLKKVGIKIEGYSSIEKKHKLKKIIDKAASIKEVHWSTKAGIPLLRSFLKFDKDIFKGITKYTKNKKILILIDDLDRADPNIIPQLLYAIKEVLDINGFSFILAFDPIVVSKALKHHHIGFEEDISFIDKIIDFPRWLPDITDLDLQKLIKMDLDKYCKHIPLESVLAIYKYLPKNPRSVRQYVRYLISYKTQIERFKKGEIDLALLLLVSIVKVYYPEIVNDIFNNEEWFILYHTANISSDRRFSDSSIKENKFEVKLKELFTSNYKNKEYEFEKVYSIIKDIFTRRFHSNYNLNQYAYLTENPVVITENEYDGFFEKWIANQSKNCVDDFLQQHSSKYKFSKDVIFKNLFHISIEKREFFIRKAADEIPETRFLDYLGISEKIMSLIQILINEGFMIEKPILGIEEYNKLLGSIYSWAHFRKPENYIPIRENEKRVAIEIAKNANLDLKNILESLAPWYDSSHKLTNKEARNLYSDVVKVIEDRYSDEIIDKFSEPDWIYTLLASDKMDSEKFELLRFESLFWKKHKNKFVGLLNNKLNIDIQRNLIDFIQLIEKEFVDMPKSDFELKQSIINDTELISLIWGKALLTKINPRAFSSFEEIKDKIFKKYGIELPLPKWWDEIKNVIHGKDIIG